MKSVKNLALSTISSVLNTFFQEPFSPSPYCTSGAYMGVPYPSGSCVWKICSPSLINCMTNLICSQNVIALSSSNRFLPQPASMLCWSPTCQSPSREQLSNVSGSSSRQRAATMAAHGLGPLCTMLVAWSCRSNKTLG